MSDGPLIVQSDKTLLLDIDHPLSTECRRAIAPFAELERSPEHIHTYRLSDSGMRALQVMMPNRLLTHLLNIHDMPFRIQFSSTSPKQCHATEDFV